jgi:hypothetical protein
MARNVLSLLSRPPRRRAGQPGSAPSPKQGEESGVTTGETVVLGDPAALQEGGVPTEPQPEPQPPPPPQ